MPLTKLSPFSIEKCIKGRVKNLLIETHKIQQSLNLLSLRQIHNIEISSSPHITLNSSRGIIHYRDDDLDELTNDDRNGQEIKLNAFLLTFPPPPPNYSQIHSHVPLQCTSKSIFPESSAMLSV